MAWQDNFPSKGPALPQPTLDDEFLLDDLFRGMSEELDEIQDSDIATRFSPFGSQTLGEETQSAESNTAQLFAITANQVERLPANMLESRLPPDSLLSEMSADLNMGTLPHSRADLLPVSSSTAFRV
jgi:hypothetical protein